MKKIILSIFILVMVIKLFSNDFLETTHDFPIDVNIEVSKKEILVGDSIVINATIKLLTEHPNYKKGMKFVIMNLKYTGIHNFIIAGMTPETIEKLTCPGVSNDWEILYTDDDKIIDDNNPIVNFNFMLKLKRNPSIKNISLPICVSYFEKINEYGKRKDYLTNKGYTVIISKEIEIICNEPGLKYRKASKSGVIEIDKPWKISNELPRTKEFKCPNIPIKPLKKVKTNEKPTENKQTRDIYKVLINTTLEWDVSYMGSQLSNVSCDANIGSAYANGMIIVFNSAGSVGAIGDINFTIDGQTYYIEIELVSSYDIQGYFKYTDYGDHIVDAFGKAQIWNFENEANPVFIAEDILDSNGFYEFTNVHAYKIGLFLIMEDSRCIILERGSSNNLVKKGLGISVTHLEFYNYNEENVNITFCMNETPTNDWNVFLWDYDFCFAFNPYKQQKRAEEFSNNSLGNPPRELLFIFAHYNETYPPDVDLSYNSWFGHDAIIYGVADTLDLIYICGISPNVHLTYNSPIQHEIGHAQHWHHAQFHIDQTGAENGHVWNGHYNDYLAWYEGFAHYFSCLIKAETVWEHYDSGYEYYIEHPNLTIDIEAPTEDPQGNDCEGAVCASLWDIYDSYEYGPLPDIVDYSILDVWNAI